MLEHTEPEAYLTLHQTLRETVANFDSILVVLLTQGNTFVIAILAAPLVAGLEGIPASGITLFGVVLGLFFLLANMLYLELMRKSVEVAEAWETKHLRHLGAEYNITAELNRIPLSAAKGSKLLYLLLPMTLILAAIVLGTVYLYEISLQLAIGYAFLCIVLVLTSIILHLIYLKHYVEST